MASGRPDLRARSPHAVRVVALIATSETPRDPMHGGEFPPDSTQGL